MTTRERDTVGEIHDDLIALRDQMKSTRVLSGFLVFASIMAGMLFAFSALAGLNVLPFLSSTTARWTALGTFLAVAAASFARFVLDPLLWKPTYDSLARIAEEGTQGLDNAYINAIQLSRERVQPRSMLKLAIDECYERTRRFDIFRAIDRRSLRLRGVVLGALVLVTLMYAVAAPRSFKAGLAMLLDPVRFVPAVGSTEIAYVRPGEAEVVRGQEFLVEAGTKAPPRGSAVALVLQVPVGGVTTEKELQALSPTEFRVSLGAADVSFDYLVEIGGTQSDWYHVTVTDRPAVKSIGMHYAYPAYMDRAPESVHDADGRVTAAYGTVVTAYVTATRPIGSGCLDFGDSRVDLLPSNDERTREATFTLRKDGVYRIMIVDTAGNAGSSEPYAVKAVEDAPPTVAVTLPGRDTSAALGSVVSIAVEAKDDYGVSEAELVLVDPDTQKERVLSTWANVESRAATLPYKLILDPAAYSSGKTYTYYARAKDGNTLTGPGVAQSARYALRVIDADEAAAALVAKVENLYARLEQILKAQEALRDEVGKTNLSAGDAKARISEVRGGQAGVRDDTTRIAADAADSLTSVDAVRRVLEGLVAGDMTKAVDDCDDILRVAAAGGTLDTATLTGTQERIIESLKRILGAVGMLVEDAKNGKLAEGTEVPSDVQEQLRKLLEDLKKFTAEEKRVIEATNNLAAVPVNDYTDAQKQRLKELATSQDDWAQFLKETWSDISKLPNQDFANPSTLKDLVETYSEVEMAADALSKQAMTVAVPHEQTGLELAEALTTHLEKWLPDTPDRIKWDMEEPVSQTDVPMAELPTNLQDIVGDLMENEEDLFSDIEDVSSSWADSIDKGAGWDAMDGPISNMSAQGVTGNALPNASEIGGRSGEGRTGRSSGEFVGDSAVGKGGRRTPTRITPDDYVAGQVNDSSPSAGGATGGGKESGAGEKGLVGPVPKQLAERISALAGKQGQIISSAQKTNVALRLAGYPNADMETALAAMQDVEGSIKTMHLGNAIRQRALLVKSLKNVTSLVGQDLVVKKDNALVLPKALQEEIIDGVRERPPKGYESLLKGYYESLSVSK